MNAGTRRHAATVVPTSPIRVVPTASGGSVRGGMILPVYARRFATAAITFAPVDGTLGDRIRADR